MGITGSGFIPRLRFEVTGLNGIVHMWDLPGCVVKAVFFPKIIVQRSFDIVNV